MSIRRMVVQYLGNWLRLPKLERDVQMIVTEDGQRFRIERACECVAEYAKSPIDGKTIVLHRCSACHELMRPHMAYCPNCGAKVVGE